MAGRRLNGAGIAAGAAALAALLAGAAFAQSPPPAPRDEVVVTGKPDADVVRSFVDQLTQDRTPENQVARWDRSVCPGIAGLEREYALMVLKRIWRRAQEVGLDAGRPGCRVNVVIIVSTDASATAKALVETYPRALGKYQRYGENSLGRRSLEAFRDSTAPVRWWFVSNTTTVDGDKVVEGPDGRAPQVRVPNASIIKRQMRQDFSRAFIVVEGTKTIGLELDALSDYLAMVSLAQIDARSDVSGFSTILNLFAAREKGEPAMTGMTAWDLSYLEALYKAPRDSGSAKEQERDIARRMNKGIPAK